LEAERLPDLLGGKELPLRADSTFSQLSDSPKKR